MVCYIYETFNQWQLYFDTELKTFTWLDYEILILVDRKMLAILLKCSICDKCVSNSRNLMINILQVIGSGKGG